MPKVVSPTNNAPRVLCLAARVLCCTTKVQRPTLNQSHRQNRQAIRYCLVRRLTLLCTSFKARHGRREENVFLRMIQGIKWPMQRTWRFDRHNFRSSFFDIPKILRIKFRIGKPSDFFETTLFFVFLHADYEYDNENLRQDHFQGQN